MKSRLTKLRPLRGKSSTCLWLTNCETAAESVSSVTAAAMTSTLSLTAPGFMVASIRAC